MPHSSALMGRAVSTHNALPGDASPLGECCHRTRSGWGQPCLPGPGKLHHPIHLGPDNSPRPSIPPILHVLENTQWVRSVGSSRKFHGRPSAPVAADPTWQVPSHPGPQVLAATAMQVCQLRTLSADHAPGSQKSEDLAQALESSAFP